MPYWSSGFPGVLVMIELHGRFLVAVTPHRFRDLEIERRVLSDLAEVTEIPLSTRGEFISALRMADVILNQNSQLDEEVISNLTRCKAIVTYGVGVDKIDIDTASRQGIQVCNVPDFCVEEVAMHTIALLLSFERKLPGFVHDVRRGVWTVPGHYEIHRLRGRTLGLLGFGRIGKRVASLGLTLGFRVITYDPHIDPKLPPPQQVEHVPFDRLLAESDYLSIHCPLTDETRGLINSGAVAKMRRGSVIINTSRGQIVREDALLSYLTTGHLRGAVLDVLESEPISPSHPFLELDSVIITPHIAWYSVESQEQLKTEVAQEARRILSGQAPRNPVNHPNV